MTITMIPLPSRYRCAALILIACLVGGARGAEPANAPFDGDWTLEFRVDTKPGGISYTITGPMVTDAFHLHFQAERRDFQFGPDRSFAWEEREQARQQTTSTGHSERLRGVVRYSSRVGCVW